MSHLKRESLPKNWPIERKGTAYVVKAKSSGIPILVVLRDLLKIASNRKEVKQAIQERKVLINNTLVKDDQKGVDLFDTISLIPSKKYYRLSLTEKGKLTLVEIKEAEANRKISKIVNKRILKGKKVQLNLSDGRNFLTNLKCKTNDSVLINFKDKKIEKCLPLQEGVKAFVFAGKHAGEQGIIEKIKLERKMISLRAKEEKINVLIKQIIVVEQI